MTSDGTYFYTYDSEGNRIGKYSDASHTTPVEKYFWDHRNRLTKTELYVSGVLDKTVEYAYGHDNRMYSRIVDATSDSRQIFARDNDQIVLELKDDNVGEVTASDLNRRALWRPDAFDQLLAEEHIGDDTYWMLPDHLGTVRDIVSHDSATDTTTLEQHNEFTSFGILLNTHTITPLALYTGRFYDSLTQIQYNRERWYDLATGRWMSVDPIGFEAGDVNLYRYVENEPTVLADEMGLKAKTCGMPDINVERKGFKEPTDQQIHAAVMKWMVLGTGADHTDSSRAMKGWTYGISGRSMPPARAKGALGMTNMVVKWQADARTTAGGCCDWSNSFLHVGAFYNVFAENGAQERIAVRLPFEATTYYIDGPTSVEEHEKWHRDGAGGKVFKIKTRDALGRPVHKNIFLPRIKGIYPEAMSRISAMKKDFRNASQVPMTEVECREKAKEIFDKYYLNKLSEILEAGVWHTVKAGQFDYWSNTTTFTWATDVKEVD